MGYYLLKIVSSALLIVAAAEVAKRSSLAGAVLASIPLVSVLAMVWLWVDTRSPERVAEFAGSIFWLVLPSLVLFLVFPYLIRWGMNFYVSLILALAATVGAYLLMVAVLRRFGSGEP